MFLDWEWWQFCVIAALLFFGCLFANYVLKKFNEARIEERFTRLLQKASKSQGTQIETNGIDSNKLKSTPSVFNAEKNIKKSAGISLVFNREDNISHDNSEKIDKLIEKFNKSKSLKHSLEAQKTAGALLQNMTAASTKNHKLDTYKTTPGPIVIKDSKAIVPVTEIPQIAADVRLLHKMSDRFVTPAALELKVSASETSNLPTKDSVAVFNASNIEHLIADIIPSSEKILNQKQSNNQSLDINKLTPVETLDTNSSKVQIIVCHSASSGDQKQNASRTNLESISQRTKSVSFEAITILPHSNNSECLSKNSNKHEDITEGPFPKTNFLLKIIQSKDGVANENEGQGNIESDHRIIVDCDESVVKNINLEPKTISLTDIVPFGEVKKESKVNILENNEKSGYVNTNMCHSRIKSETEATGNLNEIVKTNSIHSKKEAKTSSINNTTKRNDSSIKMLEYKEPVHDNNINSNIINTDLNLACYSSKPEKSGINPENTAIENNTNLEQNTEATSGSELKRESDSSITIAVLNTNTLWGIDSLPPDKRNSIKQTYKRILDDKVAHEAFVKAIPTKQPSLPAVQSDFYLSTSEEIVLSQNSKSSMIGNKSSQEITTSQQRVLTIYDSEPQISGVSQSKNDTNTS